MHETLSALEILDIHIVLGHVGIFRSLVLEANMDTDTEKSLFEAMQRKAYDEIDEVLGASLDDSNLRDMLKGLSRLSGDEKTLEDAITVFADAPESVKTELQELVAIVKGVKQRIPNIVLCFDLCELRGYEYHTGIVFAAYTPSYGRAVSKGGRYDHIGEVFGRARPASGFDSDLKVLAKLSAKTCQQRAGILVPDLNDVGLQESINKLRREGEIVIVNLTGIPLDKKSQSEMNCDRQLVLKKGVWEVDSL
jgi:ATP phosphoribosyltransferase regulatory subunit